MPFAFSAAARTAAPVAAAAAAQQAARSFCCADGRYCGRQFAAQKGLDDHARLTGHVQPRTRPKPKPAPTPTQQQPQAKPQQQGCFCSQVFGRGRQCAFHAKQGCVCSGARKCGFHAQQHGQSGASRAPPAVPFRFGPAADAPQQPKFSVPLAKPRFAPPPGSWKCAACLVNNPPTAKLKCVSCETDKPQPALTFSAPVAAPFSASRKPTAFLASLPAAFPAAKPAWGQHKWSEAARVNHLTASSFGKSAGDQPVPFAYVAPQPILPASELMERLAKFYTDPRRTTMDAKTRAKAQDVAWLTKTCRTYMTNPDKLFAKLEEKYAKEIDAVAPATPPIAAAPVATPPGPWECAACLVNNPPTAKLKCVSCETDKPGAKAAVAPAFKATGAMPAFKASGAMLAFKPTGAFGAPAPFAFDAAPAQYTPTPTHRTQGNKQMHEKLMSITAMPSYATQSFEELRMKATQKEKKKKTRMEEAKPIGFGAGAAATASGFGGLSIPQRCVERAALRATLRAEGLSLMRRAKSAGINLHQSA